ncbi:MAG: alanyl-tRNA editing protein [Clostridiaceae bacterium]
MKLYQINQDILKFNTRIKSVQEDENGVYVILFESYFYPEGGGQPADKGTINEKEVLRVFVKDNEIYHEIGSFSGLTINMPVNCIIDKGVRDDHSIQHTAQHLLSAVLMDKYDTNTLSFHLGEFTSTIDTDKPLDEETLKEIERELNEHITLDLPVNTYFRDKWNIGNIPLRKETELENNIRIVQIGTMDYSACGGTHVKSLKELRLFKLTDSENYREGMRIYYKAGKRALDYIEDLDDILRELKRELMVTFDEIPFRVVRLREERDEYRKLSEELNVKLGEAIAKGYKEDYIIEKVDYSDELIKTIGAALIKIGKIGIFYREDGRFFAFTGTKANAKQLIDTAKAGIDFRGGGSPLMAQGIVEREEEQGIFISRVYEALLKLEL